MRISAALLAVAAAMTLVACGGDDDDSPAFPARHPVPEAQALPAERIAGIWTGVVKSKDGATYTARIAIDPAGDKGFRGVSAYPGLQCGGKVTGALERPGVYRFKESITSNKQLCGQTDWDITVDLLRPRVSEWRWAGDGEAFGVLQREATAPPET
jgi:hypothetical protein